MVLFTKVYGELSLRIQQSLPRCNNRGDFKHMQEPRLSVKKPLAWPAKCGGRVSRVRQV